MHITQIAAAMFDLGHMDYDIASIIYDTMIHEIAVAQGETQPATMIPHNLPDSPESPYVDITPIVQATPAYATLLQDGLIKDSFNNLDILCNFMFRIVDPKDPTKRGCRGASYKSISFSQKVWQNRITIRFAKGASLMPKARVIDMIQGYVNHELQHMFQNIVQICGGRRQTIGQLSDKDVLQYGPEDMKTYFESPTEIQANAAGHAVRFFQSSILDLHKNNPSLTPKQMANELRMGLHKNLYNYTQRKFCILPNASPESKQEFLKALFRNVQKLIDQYAEGQQSLNSLIAPDWTTVRTNPKNRWDGLNVQRVPRVKPTQLDNPNPSGKAAGKAASTHQPLKIAEPIQVAVEQLHNQGLSVAEIAAELLRRGRYVSEKGVILILKAKRNPSLPDNPEPKAASTNFDIIVRS